MFANGGDRSDPESVAEIETCRELSIEVVLGVGGRDKADDSSRINARAGDADARSRSPRDVPTRRRRAGRRPALGARSAAAHDVRRRRRRAGRAERRRPSTTGCASWPTCSAPTGSSRPGDLVSIALPTHWRAVAATVAAWTAGLTVDLRARHQRPQRHSSDWDDFAAEVPGQPDLLVMPSTVTGPTRRPWSTRSAYVDARRPGRPRAGGRRRDRARGGWAAAHRPEPRERGRHRHRAAGAARRPAASVVLVVDASAERRERIAAQERVTCTRWA